MQGKKEYAEKLFINFRLSERVPKENFYRRLRETLDLSYLPKLTAQYYGTEGQKSIDTEVFFKFMLIGYLENINSDRQIVESAKLRLDMLYFLGYDIDEALPWHSTLSRTRQLFGEEVFLELFRNILKMCVERGMVSGKTQAIDSAFIKANASMDSLVERELNEKSKQYYNELTDNEEEKKERKNSVSRHRNLKHSDLFVSASDPDARVSRKQGKLPALNHLGIISVDTENHVICGAMADFADTKDSDTTEKIIEQTIENLQDNNLQIEEVLADTGYSSGISYNYLEKQDITAYIPPIGGYKPEKDGFTYDEMEDCYICSQGKRLIFSGIKKEKGRKTSSKEYRAATADCRNCPLKEKCCKKGKYKQLSHSTDKLYYDKAYKLLNTIEGKRKMRLRGRTVEPVWGTLLYFRRLKKVYTKGNDLANKQVLMAAAAYNLKKMMGFNSIKAAANAIKNITKDLKMIVLNQILLFLEGLLSGLNHKTKYKLKMDLLYCS
jgi:transposase